MIGTLLAKNSMGSIAPLRQGVKHNPSVPHMDAAVCQAVEAWCQPGGDCELISGLYSGKATGLYGFADDVPNYQVRQYETGSFEMIYKPCVQNNK